MAAAKDEQNQGAGGTEGAAAPAAAKLPILPLVIAMLVAVVLGAGAVGGGMLYMLKSGKIGGGVGVTKVEAKEIVKVKTHGIVMEPILVNLMDAGGKSFLRVAMTIQVEDEPVVKGAKEEKPPAGGKVPTQAENAARDTVLTVLGQQSADGLLEADGKEVLKSKIKAALTAHNPDLKLTDVFFTEFLVQR